MGEALLALPFGLAIGILLGLVGGGSILAVRDADGFLRRRRRVPDRPRAGAPTRPADHARRRNRSRSDRVHQRLCRRGTHLAVGGVDWAIATAFAAAAIAGALLGRRLGGRFDQRRLTSLFAAMLVGVAILIVIESALAFS